MIEYKNVHVPSLRDFAGKNAITCGYLFRVSREHIKAIKPEHGCTGQDDKGKQEDQVIHREINSRNAGKTCQLATFSQISPLSLPNDAPPIQESQFEEQTVQ